MTNPKLTLTLLPDTFAVCQLNTAAPVSEWALTGSVFSITRTPDELSVVCSQISVPEGTKCEKGWRCLKVEGPFDFSAIGIIASLATPLAGAGISIFVFSTYDTDYVMVKEKDLGRAMKVLSEAGHRVMARDD